MRLYIEPAPTLEEAAAIETALRTLLSRELLSPRRLRYADLALEGFSSHSWADVARRESLDSGV